MTFTRWIGLIALSSFMSAVLMCPAVLADTLLADWERTPDGTVQVGDDFDPTLDNAVTCSGCWYSRGSGTEVTYSQSTGTGATSGTHALQATLVGKGAGGMYSPTINGEPFELDTHFDYPLIATYSNTTSPAAGGPDPRFDAILAAVQGNQGLFSVEFDITYDVAQMRSIPWQPPEETVDPINNEQYPQRFFWIGMHGNMNNDLDGQGFTFTGYDQNNINPFDAEWDDNLFPVFNASFPLSDFEFNYNPDAPPTFFQLGLLYNSVFGTLPAPSNTSGVNIYFDNLRLVERDVVGPCDFDGSGGCDLADFEFFMSQHLLANPDPRTDYDSDSDNDFRDFQEFETFYDLANGGTGSLQTALAGVPEPGTIVLVGLGLLGLVLTRVKRLARPMMAMAVGTAIVFTHQSAQAQLIETFDTLGNWTAYAGAAPMANPSVMLSSIGATDGATALLVTQAEDTTGNNDFSWNAATSPNWTDGDMAFDVLSNAINIGAEHFNLLVDVTFDPVNTFDQGVNSMTVTLGLSFNGETAGTYAGESEQFTTTTTIPLSAFGLSDVEDEGVGSYSAQIGFTADALPFSFGAYIDNIRLEQISTPDLLTLEIDRSDGSATLMNLTANPISWNYMEIKSTGGSLDAAGWSSLDDQDADGAGTWIEAGGLSATELVEASLLGSHTLLPSASLPLGSLYNESINAEDVDLEIRRVGGPSFRTFDQLVTYIGVAPMGVPGDYNENGVVDAADYTVWRDALGQNIALPNEVAGVSPGMVDQADYTEWKARFGNTSGSGSGGLVAGAVPEPSTLVLWMCALLAVCSGRRSGCLRH